MGRLEYDATVGATARFQRDYNGRQPGNPVKALAAVLNIAGIDEPPLRLLFGQRSRRVRRAGRYRKNGKTDRKWRELSVSTDFDP